MATSGGRRCNSFTRSPSNPILCVQHSLSDDESDSVWESNHEYFNCYSSETEAGCDQSRSGLTPHKMAKKWSSSETLNKRIDQVTAYLEEWMALAETDESTSGIARQDSIIIPVQVESMEALPLLRGMCKVQHAGKYWTIKQGNKLGMNSHSNVSARYLKCWKGTAGDETVYFFAFKTKEEKYRFVRLNEDKTDIEIGQAQDADFGDATEEIKSKRAFVKESAGGSAGKLVPALRRGRATRFLRKKNNVVTVGKNRMAISWGLQYESE